MTYSNPVHDGYFADPFVLRHKGTYYAYAKWFYEKEKGKPATTSLGGTSTDTSLPKSKEAIKLFCTNHGFTLPTP